MLGWLRRRTDEFRATAETTASALRDRTPEQQATSGWEHFRKGGYAFFATFYYMPPAAGTAFMNSVTKDNRILSGLRGARPNESYQKMVSNWNQCKIYTSAWANCASSILSSGPSVSEVARDEINNVRERIPRISTMSTTKVHNRQRQQREISERVTNFAAGNGYNNGTQPNNSKSLITRLFRWQ